MTHHSYDEGWATTSAAEHDLEAIAARDRLDVRLACTSFAVNPPRVLVTVEDGVGPRDVPTGRAFRFPGVERLTGSLRADAVIAGSAIDQVVLVGGGPVAPDAPIDTGGFVRPVYADGLLVLTVRPGPDGVFLPFERRDPTPCCAPHSG